MLFADEDAGARRQVAPPRGRAHSVTEGGDGDEARASVSPFGEVRLAVQKGRLRFVSSVKSQDALQLTGEASTGRREG